MKYAYRSCISSRCGLPETSGWIVIGYKAVLAGASGSNTQFKSYEDELVMLPVEVIEVVSPKILDISRIHPSMTVGGILDEHHRRQAVVHSH